MKTALSLVGYANELEAAMKHVFGDSFVCPNPDCARKVTADVGKKSVTFDGDLYSPAGTLTGGKDCSHTNGNDCRLSIQVESCPDVS